MSKKINPEPLTAPQEKPTPAFQREDYPYKAFGDVITDLDSLDPSELYEIKCLKCGMIVRSQGRNIKSTYEKLGKKGCIGCGERELEIRRVDMSAAEGN